VQVVDADVIWARGPQVESRGSFNFTCQMKRRHDPIKEWKIEQSRIDLRLHARGYINRGWAVVPLWWPRFALVCSCLLGKDCTSPGKHPMKTDWATEPLVTGLDVDLWWSRHPLCNVGIATGQASKFIALDIDPDKGGWDSFNHIVKKYGQIPRTLVSITGSGGRHVLFRHPGRDCKVKNAIGCLPGIDVRGDGGQIVVPPSLHGSGMRYEWHPDGHPAKERLAPMPDWMFTLLELNEQAHQRANRRLYNGNKKRNGYGRMLDVSALPKIEDGHRNNTMCSIVGRLIWENREDGEIFDVMMEINEKRCAPPLPKREVEKLVQSALSRWAKGNRRS